MRMNKSRNGRRQIKKSKKNGGSPPGISPNNLLLNNLLQNIHGCIVHNLNNTILIVNYGLNRIEILDMERQHIGSFGEGILQKPRCINVNQQNGNIIVTDRNNLVSIFDRYGNFIRHIKSYAGIRFLFAPKEVAVASNGNIIISDIENARICCFDSNGVELYNIFTYPISMNELSTFNTPYGLCTGFIEGEERIIVADSHNSRIVFFDIDGNYIDTLFQDGDGLGDSDFIDDDTIANIAVDDNSNIVCVDLVSTDRLIIFDGESGIHRTVQLNSPIPIRSRFIRIDHATGNIYLTDTSQHLIAVFDRNYQFLHFIPEKEINYDFRIIQKKADIPAGIEDDDQCGACLELLFERSALDENNSRNNVNGYIVQLHQDLQVQSPHLFHFKCIKMWLQRIGGQKYCPKCRTDCKFHLQLTRTNIPEQNDGVDFFEPLPAIENVAPVVSEVVEDKRLLSCSQYNGNQKECINNKPKCLWKFSNKKCIDNPAQRGAKLKFISKQNKKNRKLGKRSLKK